jgi:hypothetical protein
MKQAKTGGTGYMGVEDEKLSYTKLGSSTSHKLHT